MKKFLCLAFVFYFLVYSISALSLKLETNNFNGFASGDEASCCNLHIFIWELLGSRILAKHGLDRHPAIEILLRKARAIIKQTFFWAKSVHGLFSEIKFFPVLLVLYVLIADKKIEFSQGFKYSYSGLSPPVPAVQN